jgi:hypothetical protein
VYRRAHSGGAPQPAVDHRLIRRPLLARSGQISANVTGRNRFAAFRPEPTAASVMGRCVKLPRFVLPLVTCFCPWSAWCRHTIRSEEAVSQSFQRDHPIPRLSLLPLRLHRLRRPSGGTSGGQALLAGPIF